MKFVNYTGLTDSKFAWYSLNTTQWICFYGFENSLGIVGFSATRLSLIVEVLENQAKSLEPFGYYIRINYFFHFCTANVFDYFSGVMVQFELVNRKVPNCNICDEITIIIIIITHGSPNLGQNTRPNSNQQKKENFQNFDFAVPADHRIKLKECKKKDK